MKPQMYPRLIFLAGLLETLVDLETFKIDLSSVESSLYTKSASEMSRLERSIASTRILAFSKDQTQPVASFLGRTRLCLVEWVEEQVSNITGNEASNLLEKSICDMLISAQTDLKLLKKFVCYIRDVFDITQYSKLDDGSFSTYLTIGNEIVAQTNGLKTAHRLRSTIKELLDVFKTSWELLSGYSMENLWSMFAPPTATNGRELNLVIRSENVADLFDSIMWRSKIPLDGLVELRSSMIRLDPLEQQADRYDEQNLKVSQMACLGLMCSLNVDRQSRKP